MQRGGSTAETLYRTPGIGRGGCNEEHGAGGEDLEGMRIGIEGIRHRGVEGRGSGGGRGHQITPSYGKIVLQRINDLIKGELTVRFRILYLMSSEQIDNGTRKG